MSDFIVSPNGTAVHTSQKELEESIVSSGAEYVGPTRGGDGKIFIMKNRIQMKGKMADLEIRVMPGTFDGPHRGARTVFTNAKTGEYVYPNGQLIKGTPSPSQRRALSHIHNQVP